MKEFETVDVPIGDVIRGGRLDMYPSLVDKGYFTLRVGAAATRIQAGGHIGIIPINERLTLEVVPRVPLANLARLLEVSRQAPTALVGAFRVYETGGQLYPSLTCVYAAGLRSQLDEIVDRGLLKEYERIEEVTSFPRGHIDMNRTIQRASARGIRHKLAVSSFQRTVDNGVNRCLKYAAWRLWQYATQTGDALPQRQRHRVGVDLNASFHQLQGVTLDLTESFLSDPLVTGQQNLPTLRGYYRPALDLALTIIGRKAVVLERRGSTLRLPSLVVDMSTVFEAYIREVLITASRDNHGAVRVLDGNKRSPEGGLGYLFDDGVGVVATPDVVFRKAAVGHVEHPLLLEIKYKPADAKPDRGDLNQAITYAVSYRCPHVVLVQPRAERSTTQSGIHQLGTIRGIQVSQYIYDLAADLEVEEAKLVGTFQSSGGLTR